MTDTARQSLNREVILGVALALADERGLAAVSMRAVAERVGVTPMALYPYIGSKDALLDGLVDRLLGEFLPVALPMIEASWQERVRALGRGAREMARRHPAAFGLLFQRPAVTGDAVRMVDLIYRMLLDAGVPDAEVPRLERLLTTFCMGFALSELSGRFGDGCDDPRERRARAAPGSAPAHERLAPILDAGAQWDAEYEADLDDLIALVARVASRGPS